MAVSEEVQSHLEQLTGRRWEQLAADHDMRCGRCRGGMLTLDAVNVQMDFSEGWRVLIRQLDAAGKGQWEPPRLLKPLTSITLVLCCGKCGAEVEMPLDTKEPS